MTADPYVASVQIAADPDRVFDYFTDSDALTRWMGRRARCERALHDLTGRPQLNRC